MSTAHKKARRNTPLTGIFASPACNSPNAEICGASAALFASQISRREFAAGKHSAASGKADTTYEMAFMRREVGPVPGGGVYCVVNHVAYAPIPGDVR